MDIQTTASLLDSSDFWVLIATVIFAVIAVKYGRKPILGGLDARAEKIRLALDEAERLRQEAQELLSDCQKKHRDAMNEADVIINQAKESADLIRKEAEGDLQNALKRREKQALDKIANAEERALQEVRERIVDVSMAATATIIEAQSANKMGEKLIDQSIKSIAKRASA